MYHSQDTWAKGRRLPGSLVSVLLFLVVWAPSATTALPMQQDYTEHFEQKILSSLEQWGQLTVKLTA